MWERIRREILIEYYWWKRHSGRQSHSGKKRHLDSPLSVMGILFIGSGIIILTLIGQAFAAIFRNMIPLVNGTQVAGVYWSSIFFAIKMSIAFIIFIIAFIFVLYFKFSRRR